MDLEAQESNNGTTFKNNLYVPIWEKMLLSIEGASAYSNIGTDKIRQMLKEQQCDFVLFKGTHKLIKRKKLKFLLKIDM